MSSIPSLSSWFIPGNVPSSKNSRRWTGKFFIASKTTMKYRKDTDSIYKKHAASFAQEFSKYETPVYVAFTFIRGSRHKFDHINPLEKSFDISRKMTAPLEVLYPEIDKCQLLCSKCHIEKTKNDWLSGVLQEKRGY